MFALCNPNIAGLLQGEHPEIWAQSGPRPRWFERRRQSIAISPKLLELETSNLVHSFIWGMPIGHTNNFPKSGRGLGHVTATIFGIRSNISSKLLELETWNLVCGFVWGMPIGRMNNFPKSGCGLGHVTSTTFGIRSSISSKLLELQTSNLVHGFLLGMPGFRSLSELSTLKLVYIRATKGPCLLVYFYF